MALKNQQSAVRTGEQVRVYQQSDSDCFVVGDKNKHRARGSQQRTGSQDATELNWVASVVQLDDEPDQAGTVQDEEYRLSADSDIEEIAAPKPKQGPRKRHKRTIKCPYCLKDFSGTSSALKIHIDNIHLRLRDMQCERCGVRFGRRNVLVRHQKNCTGDQRVPGFVPRVMEEEEANPADTLLQFMAENGSEIPISFFGD